jgi:undecaprenyl-diphosphatase
MCSPRHTARVGCLVWLIELDKRLFETLTLYANPPWVSALSERIGDLSTYTAPVVLLCLFYYWLNSPRFIRFVLLVAGLMVLSEATAYLLKIVIARPRPAVDWLIYVDPKALGFPSAHAVNSMALAAFLAHWFKKPLWWYLPLPFFIGISRVMANYHYPLDVVGGWAIGYSTAFIYLRLANYLAHGRSTAS